MARNGKFYVETEASLSIITFCQLEKRMLRLALGYFLRKDVYNDTIYIIDEPELHLYSIQRALIKALDNFIA
jgi:tRNA 2-selenouridine synthase SelU